MLSFPARLGIQNRTNGLFTILDFRFFEIEELFFLLVCADTNQGDIKGGYGGLVRANYHEVQITPINLIYSLHIIQQGNNSCVLLKIKLNMLFVVFNTIDVILKKVEKKFFLIFIKITHIHSSDFMVIRV